MRRLVFLALAIAVVGIAVTASTVSAAAAAADAKPATAKRTARTVKPVDSKAPPKPKSDGPKEGSRAVKTKTRPKKKKKGTAAAPAAGVDAGAAAAKKPKKTRKPKSKAATKPKRKGKSKTGDSAPAPAAAAADSKTPDAAAGSGAAAATGGAAPAAASAPAKSVAKKAKRNGPPAPKPNAKQFLSWNELVAWLRANGGYVAESVGVGLFSGAGGGWGLKALAPIKAGDALIRVPDRLTLTVQAVLAEKPEWKPLTDTIDDDGLIALYLALYRFHRHELISSTKATSFWDPYIASLSTICINGEMLDRDAMKALQPTSVYRRIVAKKRQRELEHTYITAMATGGESLRALGLDNPDSPSALAPAPVADPILAKITLSQYAWGLCTKRTRSFDIGLMGKYLDSEGVDTDGDGIIDSFRKQAALVPIADWANHGPNKTATYKYIRADAPDAIPANGPGTFVIESVADQKAGEQILISYGRHVSNAELLTSFGFVVPHNHKNDAIPLSLWSAVGSGGRKGINGVPNDPVKARIVRALGLPSVSVFRDGISATDMGAIRVALLNGTEVSAYNVARCLSAGLDEMCLSPEHELRVVVWIADQLYALLAKHTTLPAADVKTIRKLRRKARSRASGTLKPHEHMRLIAVQYRLVEKLTLITFLKRTGAW